MLRIESMRQGNRLILRLIGELRSGDIGILQSEIWRDGVSVILNLKELSVVDLAGIRFLLDCRERGIDIEESPPYVREWMKRESEERG